MLLILKSGSEVKVKVGKEVDIGRCFRKSQGLLKTFCIPINEVMFKKARQLGRPDQTGESDQLESGR